jgi:hypothetical protein
MKDWMPKIGWLVVVVLMGVTVYAQSPGDTIGWMQFDNQSWASIGQKIAIDNIGGTHLVWHQSYPDSIDWNIKYVYIDNNGNRTYTDLGLGQCPQIAINSRNQPGIVFHFDDEYWNMTYWTPDGRYTLPDMGMWPMITIDRKDRVHVAYYWFGGGREGVRNIGYTRSDDNGLTWTEPVKVDSALCPSFMITSSPVSDKVAIIYAAQISFSQCTGVTYIQSLDGVNWDWQDGAVNVTNYPDSIQVVGDDLDAVYDYNDNLHIVWNAQPIDSSGFYDSVYIRHYDIASGQTNDVTVASPWPNMDCIVGHWSNVLCKMSIAASMVSPATTDVNYLAVSYTKFDPGDCSLGGSADGEIFMALSTDNGHTWFNSTNITHSWTPDCPAGYCNSDHWSSMAEKINGSIHLFYVNDKDGGDFYYGEGSQTVNPMLYFRIPLESTNIMEENVALPNGLSLSQNYPNPFNAQTTLWYTLTRESIVNIDIFDILGQKLETLKKGRETAGSHSVVWNADVFPSGIYFCRLQTETGSQSRKMILLK